MSGLLLHSCQASSLYILEDGSVIVCMCVCVFLDGCLAEQLAML